MRQLPALFFLLVALSPLSAQRYLTPQFEEVAITADVTYGVNATVLLVSQLGQAVPQPLLTDIFEPAGDTAGNRPLIVLLPSGDFLPPQVTGGCFGTRKDAYLVDMATRLTRLGYVVAITDYRLGWNPVTTSEEDRRFTAINAMYRGSQDSRTAIRFFRKSAAEGNPYGIDSTRVVVWGFASSGFTSMTSATLDAIEDTYIPKFITTAGTPMLNEAINGNIDGTSVGVTGPGYPGFPAGDTLCYPNHAGYGSSFNLAVNVGGGIPDSSWIDVGDVPVISFHVPSAQNLPCGTDTLKIIFPPLVLPVVEVSGSCDLMPIVNREGLNNCMTAAGLNDPLSQLAGQRSGGVEGLFLFPSQDDQPPWRPWQYAGSAEPYGVSGSNCNTNADTAGLYLDTIMQYFAPRAFVCLNLGTLTSVTGPDRLETGLQVMPNPAGDMVTFQTALQWPMQSIQLFDLNGRMLRSFDHIGNHTFRLYREALPEGMYVAVIRFAEGVIAERVVFQ